MYFSLKETKEDLLQKYTNLQVDVLDTAGIEVEKLIEIIQKKNEISRVRLVVVDYLMLLTYSVNYETRQEEVQYCVNQLKRLLVEQNIPILILLSLSKYVAKDILVMDEMMKYGYMPEVIDIISYVEKDTNETTVQILKDENSYVHYGKLPFNIDMYEFPKDVKMRNKPDGGFWASHCKSRFSWYKWYEENDYLRKSDIKSCYFHLSSSANVLKIASLEECKKLPMRSMGL